MKDCFLPRLIWNFSLFFLVFSPFAFPPPPPSGPNGRRFSTLREEGLSSSQPGVLFQQPLRHGRGLSRIAQPLGHPQRGRFPHGSASPWGQHLPAHPLRNRRCCWVQRMTVAGKRRGRGLGAGHGMGTRKRAEVTVRRSVVMVVVMVLRGQVEGRSGDMVLMG